MILKNHEDQSFESKQCSEGEVKDALEGTDQRRQKDIA
jgi:hypothetical protein